MLKELSAKGFDHVIKFFDDNKDLTLQGMMQSFFAKSSKVSDTLISAIKNEAVRLYGDKLNLNSLDKLLERTSLLLSANHAGIENHPTLIASTLCSALYLKNEEIDHSIYLCCNSITPCNFTAPSSFYLDTRDDNFDHRIFRTATRSQDDVIISCQKRLDDKRLTELLKKVETESLNTFEKESISKALHYLKDKCGDLNFASASARLNTMALRHFTTGLDLEELNDNYYTDNRYDIFPLYLHLEEIVRNVLLHDLEDESSLFYKIVNDKDFLVELLHSLADSQNTWDSRLLNLNADANFLAHKNIKGTVLFYSLCSKNNLRALKLQKKHGDFYLKNKNHELRIDNESIGKALQDGSVMPNLFLSYLPLYLDHNAILVGGIFMSKYLRPMLNITTDFLGCKRFAPLAHEGLISACAMPFVTKDADGHIRPIILLDTIAKTLSKEDIQRLFTLKIGDLKELTLTDIAFDYAKRDFVAYNNDLLYKIMQDKSYLHILVK